MQKNAVIELAEQSGLIYNTELLQSKVHQHHRKALYDFAELIEDYIQGVMVSRLDKGTEDYEKVKADILRAI